MSRSSANLNWSIDEEDVLKQEYFNYSVKELKEKFLPNRNEKSIRYHARKLGLYRFSDRKIYKLLDDSLESFYWIGFLLADGSFSFERLDLPRLQVFIAEKDKAHIEKLCNYLNVKLEEKHIKTNTGFSKVGTIQYGIRFTSREYLPEIIKKFDINKNKTENPPDISKWNFSAEQLLSLIIGYIDGDGYINYSSKILNGFAVKCHKSWSPILYSFNDFIKDFFEIPDYKIIPKIQKDGILWRVCRKKVTMKMKTFIVENNLPVLDRKWGDIPTYEEYYKEQI